MTGEIHKYAHYTVPYMSSELEREIGHDEFDPVGTLGLILIYFLIIVVLWIFMYFVEFAGGDLTVVGVIV
jgi:hypothetical protein